jgi:hypothetical protein
VGYGKFSLKNDERNGKKCMHLVCDVNGKWLKDLSPSCCIIIVLSVEGKIRHVM